MRFMIACSTALVLLLGSSTAGAYELSMSLAPGSNDPANIVAGQAFVYEIYLDTESQSEITLFSVSIAFDPAVVRYDAANSRTNSYFPLYTAGNPKTGTLTTFLEPVPFDDNTCSLEDPLCANPPKIWTGNQPPLGGQVNINFIETNLNPTAATATDLLLARVAFNSVGVGSFTPEFSFDYGGNIFSVNNVDITDPGYTGPLSVTSPLLDGGTVTVPEPGLAGLALGALGTVAILARRRRRS